MIAGDIVFLGLICLLQTSCDGLNSIYERYNAVIVTITFVADCLQAFFS